MTGNELRNHVARVVHQHRHDGFTSGELAEAILDKIEPLVRAEEREKYEVVLTVAKAQSAVLADLRGKVEALRAENAGDAKSGNRLDRDFNLGKVFAYERVLALIGDNDD